MKKTPTTTETNASEAPADGANVVSLADWKARKQTSDSVKRAFKDSLDNSRVMERYKINEPTPEERMERIKNSVNRINSMLRDLKDTNQ